MVEMMDAVMVGKMVGKMENLLVGELEYQRVGLKA